MFPPMVTLVLVFCLLDLKELFFPNCDVMVWVDYLLI